MAKLKELRDAARRGIMMPPLAIEPTPAQAPASKRTTQERLFDLLRDPSRAAGWKIRAITDDGRTAMEALCDFQSESIVSGGDLLNFSGSGPVLVVGTVNRYAVIDETGSVVFEQPVDQPKLVNPGIELQLTGHVRRS